MRYDHIFDELEIKTDPFALCELNGACSLGLGRDASATLHYILSGDGEITFKSRPPLKVARGSLVFIPALQKHSLNNFGTGGDPFPDCKPAEMNLSRLMAGTCETQAGQMTALCAHVGVGLRGVTDIIDLIKEPLVEHVSSTHRMRPTLQMLLQELSHPGLGSRAMVKALLMQCMIAMLRERLSSQDAAFQWMAALADPSVWNALRLMLDAPGDPHTVESLADSVRMSRSAFAKRFAAAYGSGPMELLRDLRMRRAGILLRDTDLPVKRIAEMVGFASRSAFTRAFEGQAGLSPRAFRTAQQS